MTVNSSQNHPILLTRTHTHTLDGPNTQKKHTQNKTTTPSRHASLPSPFPPRPSGLGADGILPQIQLAKPPVALHRRRQGRAPWARHGWMNLGRQGKQNQEPVSWWRWNLWDVPATSWGLPGYPGLDLGDHRCARDACFLGADSLLKQSLRLPVKLSAYTCLLYSFHPHMCFNPELKLEVSPSHQTPIDSQL